MMFRPFPVMTLFAIPSLILLLWLGQWQLQRAEWKVGLIDAFRNEAVRPPVDVSDAFRDLRVCSNPPCDVASNYPSGPFLPVEPLNERSIRLFGNDLQARPGWRIFQAAQIGEETSTSQQPSILVETKFEPLSGAASSNVSMLKTAPIPPRGTYAADNNLEANEWYWFDLAALKDEFGEALDETVMLVAFDPNQLPANLTRTPPAQHIGYAVTWYGMAIALIVLYGAFHARAGRLRFRK
ncbi:MAG: SURF1 family cytochrome oxidase biogenesis protein [Pseudomonadota bacterium]